MRGYIMPRVCFFRYLAAKEGFIFSNKIASFWDMTPPLRELNIGFRVFA